GGDRRAPGQQRPGVRVDVLGDHVEVVQPYAVRGGVGHPDIDLAVVTGDDLGQEGEAVDGDLRVTGERDPLLLQLRLGLRGDGAGGDVGAHPVGRDGQN